MLPATAPGAAAHGPGRPHTNLEACLERLFTQSRELAGTFVRPEVNILEMGIVAATESHRRHILTMVTEWHNRPVIMQLAFGALAVYNLRTIGLHAGRGGEHPLGSRRGLAHTGPQWRALHLPRVLLRTFAGVFSSSAPRRIMAKMMALEGLFP